MSDQHPLRDLAQKLREACRDHPAYSQAIDIVNNCANHLEAVARVNEMNQRPWLLDAKTWHKMSLTLKQRWWKETDYGRTQPSDELAQEIDALALKP